MTVWYDGIQHPTALASGVVLHGDDHLILGSNYVLYADPTDNPNLHQSQIYVATLYPEGVDKTCLLESELNHGLGIISHYQGAPYTYYFGSAWSNNDVRTMAEWLLLAKTYLDNIKNPLTIEIK